MALASNHHVGLAATVAGTDEPLAPIEHARFGERLRVALTIDPRARLALVPVLSVQPLVENAIVHGFGPRSGAGTVRIEARPLGEGIELSVHDDGVGFDAETATPKGLGIGLDNVNQRLTKLFGAQSALQLTSTAGAGTRVAFYVPSRIPIAAR